MTLSSNPTDYYFNAAYIKHTDIISVMIVPKEQWDMHHSLYDLDIDEVINQFIGILPTHEDDDDGWAGSLLHPIEYLGNFSLSEMIQKFEEKGFVRNVKIPTGL
jgi:hypothetical protein